jgi:hypothetical protein
MSQTKSPANSSRETKLSEVPTWDPQDNFLKAWRRLRVLQALSGVAAILVMIWLIQKPVTPAAPRDPGEGDLLASAMVPILAAAISINLFVELGISHFEQNDLVLIAYLGPGVRWLKIVQTELMQARRWRTDVYEHYSYQMKELDKITGQLTKTKDPQKVVELTAARFKTARDLLDLAEARANSAENNVQKLVDFSNYQRFRSSVSNYFSILLGVLVATATSMQIFAIMGVQLSNPKMDIFLTGLFIGGLVYPVHQVIANIWDILTKLVKK